MIVDLCVYPFIDHCAPAGFNGVLHILSESTAKRRYLGIINPGRIRGIESVSILAVESLHVGERHHSFLVFGYFLSLFDKRVDGGLFNLLPSGSTFWIEGLCYPFGG